AREKGRFLHELARPSEALTKELQQMDRELRLAFDEAEEVRAFQHDQRRMLERCRAGRARKPVHDGDLAEGVARLHDVQENFPAPGAACADSHSPGSDAVERVTRIAL